MENKEIFIVHEYYTKSHFKALYDYADKYGYSIKSYTMLSKKAIIKRFIKQLIKTKEIFKVTKEFFNNIINLLRLPYLKDKVMIVGIAPYDKLLNKYYKCFMKNNSIYFTSWQFWDGSNFPKGNLDNKSKYEELMKKSFKGVACVSKSTQKAMSNYFKNTVVVNHAINTCEYKKKINVNEDGIKRYIYLGQLIERKNIELILNFIKSDKKSKYEFYFAGEGVLKDQIKQLASIDKRVNYLGKLTKEEIKNTLQKYDYLILPSKEEPFGIVLLEALAAGLPCIVSNALGPSEIISDGYNGFIFDKEKKEEFDFIMRKSLNINKEEYLTLSNNALKSSEKYDSKNVIRKWIDIIQR